METKNDLVIIKQNREIVGGLFWMVFAVAYFIGSIQQGLFKNGLPSSGFLPFLCSLALIIMSAIIISHGIIKKNALVDEAEPFTRIGLVRVGVALGALVLYALLLEHIGFAVATFLFMVVTLRIMEPKSWKFTVGVSFIVALISFLLFIVILEVPLPKSPLGIF